MKQITLVPAAYQLRNYEVELLAEILVRHRFQTVDLRPASWRVVPDGQTPKELASLLEALPFVDGWFGESGNYDTESLRLESATGRRERSRSQAHGYSVHSLHQYRGKFYPQLARALILASNLRPTDVVYDPFMGSGTTLIEAALLRRDSVGTDLSPMAAFLAETKALLLQASTDRYEKDVVRACDSLVTHERTCNRSHGHVRDDSYLARWFDSAAARRLDCALTVIDGAGTLEARRLLQTALSRRLRDWSLQMPDDLRIRRRTDLPDTSRVLSRLASDAEASLRRVADARASLARIQLGTIHTSCVDSRLPESLAFMGWGDRQRIGAIVTSPPYATALPYIDTDRLSLVALGLAEDRELSHIEEALIGSREITTAARRRLEEEVDEGLLLPTKVSDFLKDLLMRVRSTKDQVGFRRQNMPAVLARYFVGMDECIKSWARYVRPGATVSIIIGDSRTRIGDWLEIPTRELTVELLESHGFRRQARIDLTDQPAYSIHRANVIRAESALIHRFAP